jgi:flagellar hook-associated protein 2
MTSTTFDPTTTATSLAAAYTESRQTLLKKQVSDATAAASALDKLQSGLDAFDAALAALSPTASAGSTGSVLARSATSSDTAILTATATSAAAVGSYGLFVEQLASANQRSYGGLGGMATPAAGSGGLVVRLAGGAAIQVDLAAADLDGNGTLTPAEIAMAINSATGNANRVSASVITSGGQPQLLVGATATGAAGAITLDTSGLASGALASALSGGTELVAARDSIVWLGAQGTGTVLTQASNTVDAIPGVTLTLKKAMATGDAPTHLAVAADDGATASRLQTFVDAANSLHALLKGLTDAGDASTGKAAAVFAHDSAVRSLQSRLATTLRQSVGGVTLASYGITADRYGVLSLDAGRLATKLAANPSGLDALLGRTSPAAGVLGSLHAAVSQWTDGASGQIKRRRDGVTHLQSQLTARQSLLDDQYNSAYARYLAQFTRLQTLQAQMTRTSNLFTALFSSSDSNG